MAGWQGADEFKRKAGGKGEKVPCMFKLFGIEGCPHCATAKRLFDAKDEDAGRKAYWKKQLYAVVQMLDCPDKNKVNKILLSELPSRQVDHILKKVQEEDADTRWPTPTDLDTGRMLVFSKDKGNDEYPVYSVDIIDKVIPIDRAWWEATKVKLPRVDDNLNLLRCAKGFSSDFMFSPSGDMKEGEKAKFRLLPVPFDEQSVPFGCLFMHYVPALTAWDKAWMDVNYDPAKLADVQRALGMAVGGGADETPGFGGVAPGAPGAPGAPNTPW